MTSNSALKRKVPATDQGPSSTLEEFYASVFQPRRLKSASATTCRQHVKTIALLSRFLGRPATLADLTDGTLTAWARAAIDFGLVHGEVRTRRAQLSAIKRYAVRSRMLPESMTALSVVGAPMLLREFVDVYVERRNAERPIGREMAKDTRRHLDEAVKAITNWLGRPAAIEDLRPETINKYLVEYLESGRSPYTVKSRRTGLLVLLRRAIRLGLVDDVDVKDVRAVHCPALRIDGYDLNDMDRLIAHCATLRGVQSKTGISQSIYFASAILTMWNLGNRPGDIVEIDVADFDPRGFFYVTEQKTGKARARALQSSTKGAIAACIAVDPRRKKIWPGMKARSFYKKIGRIAAAAGLSGTARWIRRGAASVVESKNAGSARRFLNHSVPTLFEKHYRVERIVDPSPIAPTELDVPAAVFESIEPRAPLDPVEYQRRRDVNNAACRRYRERGGKAVQE